jgi:hypothetical protein
MDRLDLRNEIKRKKVAAGTVLILQGETAKAMSMLHSGLAEVLSCSRSAGDVSWEPEELINSSIRVGLIKGESIFGILGIRDEGPYETTIRAVTDCIVTIIPVKHEKIIHLLQSRISLNLQVLRALAQRIESAVFLYKNYKYLWHKFASIADTLALAADFTDTAAPALPCSREKASLEEYAASLRERINSEQELQQPEVWDHNLFLGRLQQTLGLYDEQDSRNVENMIDYQQLLFMKRLVQKPDETLIPLFKKDEPLNFYIFQFLSKALETMVHENLQLVTRIDELIRRLFLDGGWIDQILKSQGAGSERTGVFNHYLGRFCWRCRQDARKLMGIDLAGTYPVYSSLGQYQDLEIENRKDDEAKNKAKDVRGGLAKYKNLLERILEFSDMDSAFSESFRENIRSFREAPEKFGSGLNDLRETLSNQYWQLYEKCFLKIIDTDLKGFIPGIMLHFGLVDETLLSSEELAFIDEAYSRVLYTDDQVPVMTLPYFLEKIYRSDIHPSITEMGQSFREVLKRQAKMTKSQKSSAYLYKDTAEDRVRFELQNVSSQTGGLLSGSRQRSVPFLCSEAFTGTAERMLIEPEVLEEKVRNYRERDFSVFYREVVMHHKFGTDLVFKEVIPNFVLYPVSGSRAMMWQELDGTKRESPGRIFLPIFFTENLSEAVPTLLAQFRWELQKTMAGVKWTDPIEGGIVGSYYDYINFYRRNPKLTPEAKEKLREFIQKTRSDRERFTGDYLTWVNYEYEGRLRMNPAVREIFYRYAPFPAEHRKEMARKPLFTDMETKYQNRVRKELLRLESRRKRFEKAGAKIPEEIENYIRFLNR